MSKELKRKKYDKELEALQGELMDAQRWLMETGKRLVVVFEGRDAAGKGGVIKAVNGELNSRGCRVVALSKPAEREQSQWYFQRYVEHFPSAGEMVLFDRSWYNRAGVEHVMGFCTDTQYQQFLEDCPTFERLVTRDGLLIVKYWLACDQEKQEERFRERAEDPMKRWKISPIDIAARDQYADYGRARDTMLERTNIPEAPWFVVDFNDQRRGRLNLLRHLLDWLPDRKLPQKPVRLPKLKRAPATEKLSNEALWIPQPF